MVAKFREVISTEKSVSSFEIQKNSGFLPKLRFYPFLRKLDFLVVSHDWPGVLSQYKELYCDSGLGGWARSCVMTRPGQATTRPVARPRHGAGQGRWVRSRACGAHRQALGRRAHGRAGGDTAMQAATRQTLAATRSGQGPRYGHYARLGVLNWARLGVLCT